MPDQDSLRLLLSHQARARPFYLGHIHIQSEYIEYAQALIVISLRKIGTYTCPRQRLVLPVGFANFADHPNLYATHLIEK